MPAKKEVKLKIKNSPLITKEPEIKKKRVIKTVIETPKEEVLIFISSSVKYDINWIYIRRKIIGFGNVFRRKKTIKLKPKTSSKKKLTLWERYCKWFDNEFNFDALPKSKADDLEELYEIVGSDK